MPQLFTLQSRSRLCKKSLAKFFLEKKFCFASCQRAHFTNKKITHNSVVDFLFSLGGANYICSITIVLISLLATDNFSLFFFQEPSTVHIVLEFTL